MARASCGTNLWRADAGRIADRTKKFDRQRPRFALAMGPIVDKRL
jgi:hypothetical protein